MIITVLIRDNYPGYNDPLLYTVNVENPQDTLEVMHAVRAERLADLEDDDAELDLELLCAFQGDIRPLADWRE